MIDFDMSRQGALVNERRCSFDSLTQDQQEAALVVYNESTGGIPDTMAQFCRVADGFDWNSERGTPWETSAPAAPSLT